MKATQDLKNEHKGIMLEMNKKFMMVLQFMLFLVIVMAGVFGEKCYAHCDTMDGPVVKAAQKSLETGDITPLLIWVQKRDIEEVKQAFEKTRIVRKLNNDAQKLADMYFFETVVRIHRSGEGEPYTGLKPAGTELSPAIVAADKSLETGSTDAVSKILADSILDGLRTRFAQVMAKKNFSKNDVEAGRDYIKAYVIYLHYVEDLYESATKEASAQHHEEVEK